MTAPLRIAGAGAAGAVVVSALILFWQANGYWDYSDGVYAMSGRLIVDGALPYRDFVAAQPPLLYALAALLVAVDDSVGWLRLALSAVDLVLAGTVAVAVARLTGRRAAAALAGSAALLTPWALHEHAQLTPETFAAPLLLGAALAVSRGRTAWLGGLLAALATLYKAAFGLPGLLVLLAAAAGWRRRALAWGAGTLAVAGLLSLAVVGPSLIDAVVVAQSQSGRVTLHYLGGLWAQAGWNLAVLLAPALLAWPLRARAADPQLLRAVTALAAGSLLLLLSLAKQGSYLNVLVVMEPPLLVLAAAAASWTLDDLRGRRAGRAARDADALAGAESGAPRAWARQGAALALGGALALWTVQVVALVATPRDPAGFTRPGSAPAHGVLLPAVELRARVAEARDCPAGAAYTGPPAIAFRAGRRMPGDQPDPFILQMPVNAAFAQQSARDRSRCVPAP